VEGVASRIASGALPRTLEGADWRRHSAWRTQFPDWTSWCRMWLGVAWVRYQAFVRDADAEAEAEDYEP